MNADDSLKAAWHFIEPYAESVEIYGTPEEFFETFGRLPEAVRHVLAVWWLHAEVCNGGFHQLFYNSSGILAPEAVEGLRAIGLRICVTIADAAIKKLGEPYPRDREARLKTLQLLERSGNDGKHGDPFDELNEQYYAAMQGEELEARLDAYARRHTQ